MPSVPLHIPPPPQRTSDSHDFPHTPLQGQPNNNNPLPNFLHTPSGLALLELQGQLQIEQLQSAPQPEELAHQPPEIPGGYERIQIPIGVVAFSPSAFAAIKSTADGGKRGKNGAVKEAGPVLLFVGKWQKMRGEVRELVKPYAVLRRRGGGMKEGGSGGNDGEEVVEIVGIVKWKVVFNSRPEPV